METLNVEPRLYGYKPGFYRLGKVHLSPIQDMIVDRLTIRQENSVTLSDLIEALQNANFLLQTKKPDIEIVRSIKRLNDKFLERDSHFFIEGDKKVGFNLTELY